MNEDIKIRIDVMADLLNPFDYEEYSLKCAERGAEPYDEEGFLQRIAWFKRAVMKHPDLPYTEAYLTYLKDKDKTTVAPASDKPGCGGCGVNINSWQ